jgi:hypothetical protein
VLRVVAVVALVGSAPSLAGEFDGCEQQEDLAEGLLGGVTYVCEEFIASVTDKRSVASRVHAEVVESVPIGVASERRRLSSIVKKIRPRLVLAEGAPTVEGARLGGTEALATGTRVFAGEIRLSPAPGGAGGTRVLTCLGAAKGPTCDAIFALLGQRPSYLVSALPEGGLSRAPVEGTNCVTKAASVVCREGLISISSSAISEFKARRLVVTGGAPNIKRVSAPVEASCMALGVRARCLFQEMEVENRRGELAALLEANRKAMPPTEHRKRIVAFTEGEGLGFVVICDVAVSPSDGGARWLCDAALERASP